MKAKTERRSSNPSGIVAQLESAHPFCYPHKKEFCIMRLSTIMTITPFLFALAPAMSQNQTPPANQVVFVGAQDPDMVAAIQQARATLDDFLRTQANPPPGTEDFRLKVIVMDGDEVEHLWMSPIKVNRKGGFSGVVANAPRVVRNVRLGQTLRFDAGRISDWAYVRHGRQVGSFTVCALFKKMPQEEVAYYRNEYGFDC